MWTLLLIPALASALCAPGSAGTNGTGATVSVVTNGRCYTETIVTSTATNSMTICNGKTGAAGVAPTITMLGNTTGNITCAQFTSGVVGGGGAVLCNSTTGPQGTTGAQGVQGPIGVTYLPVISFPASIAPNCQMISSNTTSYVMCNGTQGAQGATGIQGAQGPAGVNGSTGAQGATGISGSVLPNFAVVDGTTYAYSCAGIQVALCTVGCGVADCSACATTVRGGIVYVGTPISNGVAATGQQTIPCVNGPTLALFIPSGVTLDLGGNILVYSTNGCPGAALTAPLPTALIQGTYYAGGAVGPQVSTAVTTLIATASTPEGGTTITIASNSFSSTGLAAGQYCSVSGLSNEAGTIAAGIYSTIGGTFYSKVMSFTNSTGVIAFRDTLPGNCSATTCTLTCYGQSTAVTDIGVRNGVLQAVTTSCGGTPALMSFTGASRITLRNLQITGGFSSAGGTTPALYIQACEDVEIDSLTVNGLSDRYVDAVQINLATRVTIRDYKYINPLLGLRALTLSNVYHSTFVNSVIEGPLQFTTSGYNNFAGVIISGGGYINSVTGGTRRCLFSGLHIVGASTNPVTLLAGDNFNQFSSVVFRGNNGLGPSIALNSFGNVFGGHMDVLPSTNGNSAVGNTGVDLAAKNVVRTTAYNTNGFVGVSVHNATAVSSDFSGGSRFVAFTTAFDTQLTTNVLGLDGTTRRVLLPLTFP